MAFITYKHPLAGIDLSYFLYFSFLCPTVHVQHLNNLALLKLTNNIENFYSVCNGSRSYHENTAVQAIDSI